jgi:hypothetical protein
LNFAALNAGRANFNPLARALDDRVDFLQIDIPTPIAHIVGVADLVAELGTTTANFTHLRHLNDAPVFF